MKPTQRRLASTLGLALGLAVALAVLATITGQVFWQIAAVAVVGLGIAWLLTR